MRTPRYSSKLHLIEKGYCWKCKAGTYITINAKLTRKTKCTYRFCERRDEGVRWIHHGSVHLTINEQGRRVWYIVPRDAELSSNAKSWIRQMNEDPHEVYVVVTPSEWESIKQANGWEVSA